MTRHTKLTAVLLATASLALAAPSAGATTNTASDFGPAEIRTGMYAGPDDLCLEVADSRTDDGAPVRIATCTGGDNQKWTQSANGWINLHSSKCLEIPAFSTTPGTQADQWTCNSGANQAWTDPNVSHSGTPRHIVNANSGLSLDVAGGVIADGTPVIQWDFHAGDNQFWHYNPDKGPF
ncbi:ricin-type beta-trefoil lectin domain protein [Streptomyces kaniharaensis]|uniref:Ricin-type beta-trefoil lectin domain protein n=1 Tax=Streptomyces kaniharaensis TaxID=212423 RepID=A0A6N7KZL9_9ACTN|nr:RICIN domain-containing protein [Streptomyces kaniharaensis]MQS16275.1 ricin-type beta-trefoil lectin domain protein [Streptomyces kaniharaensis]